MCYWVNHSPLDRSGKALQFIGDVQVKGSLQYKIAMVFKDFAMPKDFS